MNKVDKLEKPVIFIGTGRSGTTIISEIVFRHRDLAFPSNFQTKFIRYPQINLLRNIVDNNLWRFFGQKKQLNKTSIFNRFVFMPVEAYPVWDYLTGVDIDFSRNFLLDQKANDSQRNLIRSYFKKMVKFQNKKRLAFKITGPSRLEYLLSIFPDAQIVNVIRNDIPTISSFLKVAFWKSRGYNKLWWIDSYNEKEIQWAKDNENDPIAITTFQIKKLKEMTRYEVTKLKPSYLELKYEDFIKEPMETVNSILKFLDLKKDRFCLDAFKGLKIFNQNKDDKDYFNEFELTKINKILNS